MLNFQDVVEILNPSRGPSPEKLRLLVVDDEMPILNYVNRILSRAGYRPALASSGSEAIGTAAAMGGVDLLVTDLAMPAMSGEELAISLRRTLPRLKVLYQTGFSDRLFVEQRLLRDGEAFIEKPYSVDAFEEAVSLLVYGTTRVKKTAGFYAPALWVA